MNAAAGSRSERYWLLALRPTLRGAVVFVGLAVVGFAIWEVNPPGALRDALGVGREEWFDSGFYSMLDLGLEPMIRSLVAFLAGLLVPRGFYLWGLALALHTPLTHFIVTRWIIEAGHEPFVGGTAGMVNYLALDLVLTILMIFVYTAFAGLGALARFLLERRRWQ